MRVAVTSALLLCLACNSSSESSPPASAAEPSEPSAEQHAAAEQPAADEQPAAAEPSAEQAAELSDKVEDTSFVLALQPSGEYEAGKLGSFAVALEPRGVYHINQEYPISISLSADDEMGLAKSELARTDAAEFGEKKARFDVPFTPAEAGEHKVQAKVKFAVCTPETCVPDERTLALAIAVK